MARRVWPTLPAGYARAISVSQLELAELCPERWRQKYIAGLKDPGTDASRLGDEGHRKMELWVDKGVYPDNTKAGKLAQVLLKIAPMPTTPSTPGLNEVEKHFFLPMPGGALMQGFADLVRTQDGKVTVYDYKFTSSLDYCKDLGEDWAAAVYTEAFQADELRWLYVRTKKEPLTKAVVWPVEKASVKRRLKVLDEKASVVNQWHDERPAQLPGNLNSCHVFNKPCFAIEPCPWQVRRVFSLGGKDKMSGKPNRFQELLAAARAGKPVKGALDAPGAAVNAAAQGESNELDASIAAATAEAALKDMTSAPPAGFTPPSGPAEPKKKGRPRGSKNKSAMTADALTQEQAEAAAAEPLPKTIEAEYIPPEDKVKVVDIVAAGLAKGTTHTPRLFINCAPEASAFTNAADVFARAHDLVAAETGVSHYSQIEGFGKGSALFAQAVGTILEECLPVELVVYTNQADYWAASGVLHRFYADRVRGVAA